MQSTVLYGAPIWHAAIYVEKYKNLLIRLQRKMLIRVASAYRTVSAEALQMITGVISIDLMVRERREIYEGARGEVGVVHVRARDEIMDRWQARWTDNLETGQWTKALIPDLSPWIKCGFHRLDYPLTQFLTAHGSFRKYTFRIQKVANELCIYCNEIDSPEQGSPNYGPRAPPIRPAVAGTN